MTIRLGRDEERLPFSRQWWRELGQALLVMQRVISAIVLREARTRYGNSPIGYAWALINPVIELAVIIAAFTVIGRNSPVGVPLPVFLITGLVPFMFWRGSVGRGSNGVAANLGLLSYPQVMPSDVIIARVLLEGATTTVVLILLVLGMHWTQDIPVSSFLGDPTKLLFALLGLFYFSMCSAFFSSGLGRILPIWPNLWGYMSRPIWLMSGVFYTLKSLPEDLRWVVAYNPLAHVIEWIREGAIPGFHSSVYQPSYVLLVATGFLLAGLIVDRLLMLTGDEEIVS